MVFLPKFVCFGICGDNLEDASIPILQIRQLSLMGATCPPSQGQHGFMSGFHPASAWLQSPQPLQLNAFDTERTVARCLC